MSDRQRHIHMKYNAIIVITFSSVLSPLHPHPYCCQIKAPNKNMKASKMAMEHCSDTVSIKIKQYRLHLYYMLAALDCLYFNVSAIFAQLKRPTTPEFSTAQQSSEHNIALCITICQPSLKLSQQEPCCFPCCSALCICHNKQMLLLAEI